ncbi:Small COPII coat GTPase SAR1 [Mycena venus]|uniref:Small COPII coat GTPase SAR1 n=1 Tax=Mycena venus TaxID=2733690 RepID=A0A8H7CST0_9AGAR|nr:Small COPII coat GTPase SAR1 [Mycena venus]
MRRLWGDYFPEVDAIIFLVDSAEFAQFSKSHIDAVGAVGKEELRHHLGLYQTSGKGKIPLNDIRPSEIFMCSVIQRQGNNLAELNITVGDPYTQETCCYTPLLALLLVPNEWLHFSFGKYLFAACDIFNGALIYDLLVSFMLPSLQTHGL